MPKMKKRKVLVKFTGTSGAEQVLLKLLKANEGKQVAGEGYAKGEECRG